MARTPINDAIIWGEPMKQGRFWYVRACNVPPKLHDLMEEHVLVEHVFYNAVTHSADLKFNPDAIEIVGITEAIIWLQEDITYGPRLDVMWETELRRVRA